MKRQTTEKARKVHQIHFKEFIAGSEQKFLFISDVHYDSKKCDRKLLKKHLDKAKEEDALIIIVGDFFDIMATQADRRATKDLLREEYVGGNYIDRIVKDGARFLQPYAHNIFLMSEGNHESAIRKYKETDILERVIERINTENKSKIYRGGYSGYIQLFFECSNNNGNQRSQTIHYHHGFEGGRRSKGTLAIDLDMAKWNADIYLSGHSHHKWHFPMSREYLTVRGFIKEKDIHHFRLGSYKKLDEVYGWSAEKKFEQPRLGGYWGRFYLQSDEIKLEVIEAH
tara:strand:- start:167 stop:1018 length:852 start_codon:yes stop_codon:yes gene_type:complete